MTYNAFPRPKANMHRSKLRERSGKFTIALTGDDANRFERE
jgi:hypothetical protein